MRLISVIFLHNIFRKNIIFLNGPLQISVEPLCKLLALVYKELHFLSISQLNEC